MREPDSDAALHAFGAYERLLVAAQAIGHRSYLIALLGGEAGLRLEWGDVDLERRQIRAALRLVRRADGTEERGAFGSSR